MLLVVNDRLSAPASLRRAMLGHIWSFLWEAEPLLSARFPFVVATGPFDVPTSA